MQGSLSLLSELLIQAMRRRRSFIPAQSFLTSASHTFLASAIAANFAWHGWENTVKCCFKQAAMRPWPGCIPAHFSLISALHAPLAPCCCAVAVTSCGAAAVPYCVAGAVPCCCAMATGEKSSIAMPTAKVRFVIERLLTNNLHPPGEGYTEKIPLPLFHL